MYHIHILASTKKKIHILAQKKWVKYINSQLGCYKKKKSIANGTIFFFKRFISIRCFKNKNKNKITLTQKKKKKKKTIF